MGFAVATKAALLLHLSLFVLSSFAVSSQILPEALPPHYHGISPVVPPAHPPSHHHHHHHPHPHPHPHQPTPSPTKPPTHPPVYPPPKAPKIAPVYPPPKSPSKPPTYAPPPKSPSKPPTYAPPPKSPSKPPTYAPPPKPPTKPPTYAPPPKPPVYPPTKPPTAPPTKPPVHPPTYPPPSPSPAKPPTYPKPQRSLVAVQGVVFCKSCKYAGSNTLLGAKPILGATVKLTCKNTKYKQEATAKTDKNGYFFLQAPKTVTSFGAHKCTVSLVSSPMAKCSKPSNLHGGLKGATLRPEKPFTANKLPFILYTVGPFAFEPKCY
ncbi:hypothetical protein E1A91_A06G134800v1 [Gossypium mustelinum]|uniref:Uncharacterized protein n=1 Tax=Gossypium mustelinum TaxID=34275 RepID=A0A5D2YWE2_GOSMU|nr:hypothetical protein E1A91_A06G134800v1 [Gossypium mustelinum]